MLRFKYKELLSEKEFTEDRKITLDEVAQKTGITRTTLSRISSVRGYNTKTRNIDKLCCYFDCAVEKLIQYIPDKDIIKNPRMR